MTRESQVRSRPHEAVDDPAKHPPEKISAVALAAGSLTSEDLSNLVDKTLRDPAPEGK